MFTFALNVMPLVYTVQMHIFGLIKKNCYSLFLFQNARQKAVKIKLRRTKRKKKLFTFVRSHCFWINFKCGLS